MNTLIFRTAVPPIAMLMAVFSVVVLLRGHNDPGGGFIGGLIAASAVAVCGMAFGVRAVRKFLRVNPIAIAAGGIVLAILAGLLSAAFSAPFLTGLWLPGHVFGVPGVFDIGVYLVVFGTISAIALGLEDSGEGT
jgi:multicomponent Na+:H+ antiporter subunit B